MLIQNKKKYLSLFLILICELLCYTESSFCAVFDTQKNKLVNKYNYFHSLDNIHNKTTNESYNKSIAGIEKKRLIKSTGAGDQASWSNAFNFKKTWGTTVDPRSRYSQCSCKNWQYAQ